ncbi:hypothetical protein AHAS_Ahas13G0301100 [Arachis hypogaea]
MEYQHSFGGCRSSTAPVDAGFDGGRCREPPLASSRLNRADNMVMHVTSKGGNGVVLHLDNPLKEVDCGRLSVYLFETRVEVSVTAPLDWKWFSLVGSSMGLLSWIHNCYHFNHCDDWSAYAFVDVYGCADYWIVSLTKSHLASAGYDMQVFYSAGGQWSRCVRTSAMVDRLGNKYAVSKLSVFWVNSEGRFQNKPVSVVKYSTFESTWNEIEFGRNDGVDFVSYERSSSRFGVHLVTIKIGAYGGMEWGRLLFIGDPNLTDTP